MRKFIFLIPIVLLFTGCLDQKEVQDTMDDLKVKKTAAINSIETRNFSLEGLLSIHDYFFSFGEKVHLMKAEEKAAKMIDSFIKDFGVKGFCEAFIMPTSIWKKLEEHCSNNSFYKCSPEIKDYAFILDKFKAIIGSENQKRIQSERLCN